MTKQVFLPITHCSQCPYKNETNFYSTDGWDRMCDWVCEKLKDNKTGLPMKIQGSVEWHEEKTIQIPDWCPLTNNK